MRLEISDTQYWLADQPVDFRMGVNRLCHYVKSELEGQLEKSVFIFYSKDRKKIKILGWHRNGFVCVCKYFSRRHSGLYFDKESSLKALNKTQLSWLLAGLDWQLMSACDDLEFEDFY